mgnify:CR=1 FL=1
MALVCYYDGRCLEDGRAEVLTQLDVGGPHEEVAAAVAEGEVALVEVGWLLRRVLNRAEGLRPVLAEFALQASGFLSRCYRLL